jgi:hypothetical protein
MDSAVVTAFVTALDTFAKAAWDWRDDSLFTKCAAALEVEGEEPTLRAVARQFPSQLQVVDMSTSILPKYCGWEPSESCVLRVLQDMGSTYTKHEFRLLRDLRRALGTENPRAVEKVLQRRRVYTPWHQLVEMECAVCLAVGTTPKLQCVRTILMHWDPSQDGTFLSHLGTPEEQAFALQLFERAMPSLLALPQ